jgi:predicted TIM-barrel fold metal-dependent hydrolase
VVLLESGVSWLPGFLWRFAKFWRGVRSEVPWVDRSPAEIVRDHFRLTIQPFDVPSQSDRVERVIDHLRSDAILLYASDFPHWQFDGDEIMPAGIPGRLHRRIMVENPLATYSRLEEHAQ